MRTLSPTFHLTHNCNLRCSYCYTGEKFGRGMSRDTAEEAVDFCLAEAKRQGAARLSVVFFGGEPLLRHKLLCHIIDTFHARRGTIDVDFKLSTNGLLLTETVLADLVKRRVYISLSIDGEPALQNVQRPDTAGRGAAERLKPIIDRVLAWNPCTNVTCVVTPASAGALPRSVNWLYHRGFAYITTTVDFTADWTRADLKVLTDSYTQLGDWYERMTLK